MIDPQVQWVAPASMWAGYARADNQPDNQVRIRRPEILRFATDSFMEEFVATLEHAPQRLHEWRVRPETWEGPTAQPPASPALPPLVRRMHEQRLATALPLSTTGLSAMPALSGTVAAGENLKLYQPAHLRFYVLAACLVCRLPGMPDRMLNFGADESAGYVVRRLRPKAGNTIAPPIFDLNSCDEYAFVNGNTWQHAEQDELVEGEELLPMFGVSYTEEDSRRRRVLAGVIPVGRRETYVGAAVTPVLPAASLATAPDPRKAILMRRVTDPWRAMIENHQKAVGVIAAGQTAWVAGGKKPPAPDNITLRLDADDQAHLLSWLILIDLGDFLNKYLPSVWSAIEGNPPATGLDVKAQQVYAMLANAKTRVNSVPRSLVWALLEVQKFRTKLELTQSLYSTRPVPPGGTPRPSTDSPFPDFVFPLYEPDFSALVNQSPSSTTKTLDDRIAEALETVTAPVDTPPLPLAAQLSASDLREPAWFIIRCVFERPNCTPLIDALLSEPTEPFQMAPFFDADAPARPIRINLPVDISPAGLRKFDRNTAFMISDALCGQMKRLGGISLGDLVLSVLPWPFHKDLPEPEMAACPDGMICSLSLPIITLVALILLIIFVVVFNLIFWWLPFFMTCFPLPNFNSKKS